MGIHQAYNGDIELAYQVEGAPDGVRLLLAFAGAGTQMVMWPPALRSALVDRGFHVATMDQRDSGLSTHLTRYDNVKRRRGERPYTLRDMTDDVVAVLDALEWPTAVVVGASLGGAIAQATAIHHPDRVSGLVSMISTPTNRLRLNRPRIGTVLRIVRTLSGTPANREEEGQRWVDLFRVVGTGDYPPDDAHWREAGRLAFDRHYPAGAMRQVLAIHADGDRRAALATLRIPTLVVHGRLDGLASWRAGKATADAVPGARFLLLPRVGHHLPPQIWPRILDEMSALFIGQEVPSGSTDRQPS